MKSRQGFISNSSTSSFVIIGYRTEEGLDDEKDLDNGKRIVSLYVEDAKGAYITGIVLAYADSDSGSLDEHEFATDDIQNNIDIVAREMNVDKSKIKLYTGTRMC